MLATVLLALTGTGLAAARMSQLYTSKTEASYPAEGDLLTVNGHGVHVIRRGPSPDDAAGAPVLMIHGASANAREFTASLAPHLQDTLPLLMPDRPGHGWSERFPGADSLSAQAAQMAGILDQLAPAKRAVIVGHSFGGAVALRLALDRPDLVSSLVLLAPVTHGWKKGGTAWYNGIGAHPLAGPLFSQLIPILGPGQVKAGMRHVFSPAPPPEDYFDKAGIRLYMRPRNFRANAQDMRRLNAQLTEQSTHYGKITAPITVFSGSRDTVLSPKIHTRALKQQVKLDLVILENEGHMPHHREAMAVAKTIRQLAINHLKG